MPPTDEDTLKRRYREFLDLMPLTIEIAGLHTSSGPVNFNQEQMEVRARDAPHGLQGRAGSWLATCLRGAKRPAADSPAGGLHTNPTRKRGFFVPVRDASAEGPASGVPRRRVGLVPGPSAPPG